jgi:iodotyrosine deiodinase
MSTALPFIPYAPERYDEALMMQCATSFRELMERRRSVRFFSDRPVPQALMEELVRNAGTAPSGANKQPWTFCLVGDPGLKRRIREEAEREEHASYHGRMPPDRLADLAPLGTDWRKPFLEVAPWLVVVFKQVHGHRPDGTKAKHYYVEESVGIACGLLIAAIHQAGLSTLTHTPSPMTFLQHLLGRPANERAFLLLPVGYAAADRTVPDIRRKPLDAFLLRHV